MIQCAVTGAGGRMGKTIIGIIHSAQYAGKIRLSGALEMPGSVFKGMDAGIMSGVGANHVTVTDIPEEAFRDADVIIDFSGTEATLRNLAVAATSVKKPAVIIGTTGFTEEQKKQILSYSSVLAVLLSPNMSVGVNVLFHLTAVAAGLLGDAFDAEITETHHKLKKDAPSGTAVKLKEILLEALGRSEENVIYGREGLIGERPDKEIAVHALRGGDVVGDHTVFFFGDGERIELTHKAGTRATFAAGAVRSAVYLFGKPPGNYSMKDVLGL